MCERRANESFGDQGKVSLLMKLFDETQEKKQKSGYELRGTKQ